MNDNQNPEKEAASVPEEETVKPKRAYRRAVRTPAPFALGGEGAEEERKITENTPVKAPEVTPFPEKKPETYMEEDEIARLFRSGNEDPAQPVKSASAVDPGDDLLNFSRKKEKKAKEEEPALSPAGNVFDWIKSFLFSLAVVIFIFTLLFRGVNVNGGSMLPTLENNEYLIISDLLYTPKCGDIVVVQSPAYKNGKEPLIKRIIATEGQTVKINFKTWEVWVDEVLLEEDYILKESGSMMNCEDMVPDEDDVAEVTVDEGCIFVMGDHRNDSLDSRSEMVGQIDQHYIMGRVILRVTPFDRFGKVN